MFVSQNLDYLPLTTPEIGTPFKLTKLPRITNTTSRMATKTGPLGSTYRTTARRDPSVLSLAGEDKARKPWSVDVAAFLGCAGGAQAYEGDLDRDGIQDAVLMVATCGNGLAPSYHLVVVTFDAAGRPIPFEAEGYFNEAPAGIDSLVDLNRDGRAELLFMNFNDGYWITNIYTVQNARWSRIRGAFAGHTFPLYTRFTNRPNKKPVAPEVGRHPFAPDLSIQTPVVSGTVAEWKWISSDNANHTLELRITDVNGQTLSCSPVYWNDSAKLVIDEPSGRRIARLSQYGQAKAESFLNEVVARKLKVLAYGSRQPTGCTPELVWAEP